MGEFVIRKSSSGFKFDMHAANGQVVAVSEVYASEAACRAGAMSVCANAPSAPIEDISDGESGVPNPKFQIYMDKKGRYRFRLKARNGRIIAVSQSYGSKDACLSGIESVRKNADSLTK